MLGPHAHGRRFRWDDYLAALDRGDFDPDCRFELGRGIFIVSQVANPWHGYVINRIHDLMAVWRATHPSDIDSFLHGSESRLVIPILESDRHPDFAVYDSPPPSNDSRAWWNWPPSLAVEVVSPGSGTRDHEEKAEEYLAYGVGEYWVLDPDHPDRPGPSARMFTRNETGDAWEDRWEDGVVTTDRFPGLEVPVAEVLAPLPEPADADGGDAGG